MVDLKPGGRVVSKEATETALDELETKWYQLYPMLLVVTSQEGKFHN